MADHPRNTPAAPPLGVIATVPPIPPSMPTYPWSISSILCAPHQASSNSPEPAAKRRRTIPCADGCTWCRKKKIKCSGRLQDTGPCANCSRDGLACSFVAGPGKISVSRVTPSQDVTEAGTPRKRAQRACRECHAHKTKCSGSLPVCARCTNLGIECIYEPSKRKFSSAPGSAQSEPTTASYHALTPPDTLRGTTNMESKQLVSPITSLSPNPLASTRRPSLTNHLCVEDLLARKDIITRHFQIWFKLFGPLPLLSILHPQTTFLEIEEQRLEPTLGRIVCAVTARIICPGSRTLPEFAQKCTEQVDYHIFQNISSCLRGDGRHNLIVLLIAICHNWLEFQMGKVWMYMGFAGRLITALQLNCVGAGDTPIQQEITRRLVWAVWNIDRFLAGGFEEHLVLKDEYMRIKMPVMDINFPGESNEMATAISPSSSQPSPTDSQTWPLNVYHINLNRVRHRILSFTKQLPVPPTPDKRGAALEASDVIGRINGLQKILSSFNANLPTHLKVCDSSLERWVNLPESASYIMLWTTFWGLYIELYLFSIPGLREEANPELSRQLPITFVVKSQKQAVAYAISLSQFWRSVQDIVGKRSIADGTERLYTTDQTLIINVIRSTTVLLVAREHRLYDGVQEESTAPLIPQEPITDEFLESLIQSNMGLFKQFEHYYPVTIEKLTQDLRLAVDNSKKSSLPKHHQEAADVLVRRPPEDGRLPGPHLMLESASAASHNEDRDTQRNRSAADQYMRQRKEQNLSDYIAPPAATASEASLNYIPRIPEWLNHARAQEIPPGVPALPRGNISQALCPTVSTMPVPQLTPGLASTSAPSMTTSNYRQLEGTVPSALGIFNPPSYQAYGTVSMYYARAKGGSLGTRIPIQPDYDHYERAAGKRLPFPDFSSMLRNENPPLM